MNSLTHDYEEGMFDKADMYSKRPESARVKLPVRDSLLQRSNTANTGDSDPNK